MSSRNSEQGRPSEKTVLIVDDHPMLRRGLAVVIDSEPGLTVCAEAATCNAAREAIRENQPHLVIVNLALDGCDSLDFVKYIKTHHPKIPTLVHSTRDESLYAERSLRAGAKGYLTKYELGDAVLVAIRRLLDGETYMSEKLTARLAGKYVNGRTLETDSPLHALSDRQLQVFRLLGRGGSTRQIAKRLQLSVKTIESHREHIMQKLAIESAPMLVYRATQWVETGRTH